MTTYTTTEDDAYGTDLHSSVLGAPVVSELDRVLGLSEGAYRVSHLSNGDRVLTSEHARSTPETLLMYGEDPHVDGVPDGWELVNGYSGQHGYAGPVMHPSEFIGGAMAAHVMETPGVYVAVIVDHYPDPEVDGDEPDGDAVGWALLHMTDDDPMTCGTCGHTFPDIYPAGRCPREADHESEGS